MNPLTNVKNIKKLSEQELKNNWKTSWHDQYKESAWVFVGGLPYDLTEGDIICLFSQYGEIVNLNLVRDKATGKSKGYCFLCYEDQRSTILAVDNLNGVKVIGRILRVDHVADYKAPKDGKIITGELRKLREEGCAFIAPVKIKTEHSDGEHDKKSIRPDSDLTIKKEADDSEKRKRKIKSEKKDKEKRKVKEKKKKKRRRSRSNDNSSEKTDFLN